MAEEGRPSTNTKRNEVKEIKTVKQLEKVELDFESPRIRQAMENLGVKRKECAKKYYCLITVL